MVVCSLLQGRDSSTLGTVAAVLIHMTRFIKGSKLGTCYKALLGADFPEEDLAQGNKYRVPESRPVGWGWPCILIFTAPVTSCPVTPAKPPTPEIP